jgi:hypothetical protein
MYLDWQKNHQHRTRKLVKHLTQNKHNKMSDMRGSLDLVEFQPPPTQSEEGTSQGDNNDSPALIDFMDRLLTNFMFSAGYTHRINNCTGTKVVVVTDNAKLQFQRQEDLCSPRVRSPVLRREDSYHIGIVKQDERWSNPNQHSPTCVGLTCPSRAASFDFSVHLAPTLSKKKKVVMDYNNIPFPLGRHSRANQCVGSMTKLEPNLTNHCFGLTPSKSNSKPSARRRKVSQ